MSAHGPRAADALRTLLRGTGQVLITLGLVVLLFVFYELKVTNLYTGQQQAALADDLEADWRAGPAVPQGPNAGGADGYPEIPIGRGFAKIYIPELGRDFVKVVVEGVGVANLKKGPGHYPRTARPGEKGNVVIAGHRTTYGAPFNRVDELEAGDAIVLETAGQWFTYRVRSQEVVTPTAVEVTYPVPHRKGAAPTEQLLTLTTCHPKFSARARLVVYAVLETQQAKAQGRPAALAEASG